MGEFEKVRLELNQANLLTRLAKAVNELTTGYDQADAGNRRLLEELLCSVSVFVDKEVVVDVLATLIAGLYDFRSITILTSQHMIDCEDWIAAVVAAATTADKIHFGREPLGITGLPQELSADTTLLPLNGVNTFRVCPGGDVTSKQYVMWNTNSNQANNISILFVDDKANEAYFLPAQIRHTMPELKSLLSSCLSSVAGFSSKKRSKQLNNLETATSIAHAVLQHPAHFGHYVQNNLSHISRLEQRGVLWQFQHIYRAGPCDFFSPQEEQLFFSERTGALFDQVKDLQQAKKTARDRGEALVASKGSTLYGIGLSTHLRQHITSSSKDGRNDESHREAHLKLCVGVRGGSKEAINLTEIIESLIQRIRKKMGCNVDLLIDGMSASSLNSLGTTAYLSLEREQQLSATFASFAQTHNGLTVESVVNMPMIEQVTKISECHASISHFGSSCYKYGALAGIPVIEHGMYSLSDRLNNKGKEVPPTFYFGQEYILSQSEGPHVLRNNYFLNKDLIVPRLFKIIKSLYDQSLK